MVLSVSSLCYKGLMVLHILRTHSGCILALTFVQGSSCVRWLSRGLQLAPFELVACEVLVEFVDACEVRASQQT